MTAGATSKMLRGRMPSAQSFFCADGLDDGAVHFQGSDGRATRGTDADDFNIVPAEVQSPRIAAGTEERSRFCIFRVGSKLPRTFSQGTRNTRQRQIVQRGCAANGNGDNMVNVKNRLLAGLGESTVFAAALRPMNHLPPELRRNVHATTSGDCLRDVSAAAAAKAFQPLLRGLLPRVFQWSSKDDLDPACPASLVADDGHLLAAETLPDRRAFPFAVGWTYSISFSAGEFSRTTTPSPRPEFFHPSRFAGSVSIPG